MQIFGKISPGRWGKYPPVWWSILWLSTGLWFATPQVAAGYFAGLAFKVEPDRVQSSEIDPIPALQELSLGPIWGEVPQSSPASVIGRYKKFELTFEVSGAYTNPFDPHDIRVDGYFITPGNEILVQPGFYFQDYVVSGIGGSESYISASDPVWKIRFAPRQVGLYHYYVQVTDGNGNIVTSSTGTIEVTDSNDSGFIGVSTHNPRYFEFDSGDPFIGIGLNVGWWQFENRRISTYQYYLNRMGEYRANMARVWMTNGARNQNWILSIQDLTLGADYNLEEAWAFDYILNMAGEADVYFLLTLDDVNQYAQNQNWEQNLYSSALGGPCDYRSEIFTNPDARIYQQRIFRYIVARWGYSPHIISWELFNEIDELQWSDTQHWNRQAMIDWHQETAQYIKSIDAHQHLVNTSTGSFKVHPDLYETLPEMELAQIHFYYVPGWPGPPSDPAGRDIADLTRYYAYRLYSSVSAKPCIIGEWGLLNQAWIDSPDLANDDQGIHLHNGLWASLMSGLATTGLNWHWREHQSHDTAWWRHYRAIANYTEGINTANLTVMKPLNVDFTLPSGADDRPDAFAATNDKFRAMGLRRGELVYAWIQNTDNTWWNYIQPDGPDPFPQTGTITVYDLTPNAVYRVERWDSYEGLVNWTDTVSAQSDGSLQLVVVNLISDIALKVIPLAPGADFRANPEQGQPPLSVQFTDQSSGAITNWLWAFGDGLTDTLQHPAHTYTTAGFYTVTLTVTGPAGSDTTTVTNYIIVTEPDPNQEIYLPVILK